MRPFSEWVWQSQHFRQCSDSSGDLPNILGKVGRAAMGFGAALAICCHHQRNTSQRIRSLNTILCHFRHFQVVLYITKYLYTRHTQCSKHSYIECLRHPQAIHMRPFSEWVWQSQHFRQCSDSSGDLPNILGKVGRAAMGFGAALAICCHHQRNTSQRIRSLNTILCHFRHFQVVLYITNDGSRLLALHQIPLQPD